MEKAAYIPKTWDLPEAIRVRLGESVGRQRLIDGDGHLLLLLHQVPQSEDDEVRTAAVFWRNPAGEWKSAPIGGGLTGLQAHLASYQTAVHDLDAAVEVAKSARDYFDVIRRMNPLQRATRNMSAAVQALRQALPGDTRIITLRDTAIDAERAIELAAADAKAGMDFTVAESATQQAAAAEVANQEARRLNKLAAFFLPLATLVGVFGMNPPETFFHETSFLLVLAAGVALGLLARALIGQRVRTRDE
jgi:hypothetical protein